MLAAGGGGGHGEIPMSFLHPSSRQPWTGWFCLLVLAFSQVEVGAVQRLQPDLGGGVGGLECTVRGARVRYNVRNGRGDVIAQFSEQGALAWTVSYEAFE